MIGGYDLIARQVDFAKMTPKLRGNIAAGWRNARWSADAYIHYVTAYDSIADQFGALEKTPAYATLGGRVSYLVSEGLTVALSGQNLGAAHQAQGLASALRAPRRVIFSLTRSW
jgi:outer membrane receptor protein involved in Fe transport